LSIFISIIVFVIGVVFGAVAVWFLKNRELDSEDKRLKTMEAVFGNLSKEALQENIDTFLKLSKSQFSDLLKSSDHQLDEKKKLIDASLKDMKTQMENLNKRTGELKGQMEESQTGIKNLNDTTTQLRQILSSSQARGQWGERMVEDILNFIGLNEGINYLKQKQEGSDRPDYTFLLPRNMRINMDVKFPLQHYENYLSTESDAEKKSFLTDVRNHIKAIAKRSYIDPAGGTVDYVLMFIPNESIYTFLNQEDNELIDFSLSKKIILCSPITLYAVLSLIRQSVENFAMEQKAGEMQTFIRAFTAQWTKFVEKMDSMGKSLSTVQKHYDELSSTRVRQLEKPVSKILEMKLNQSEEIKEIEE